MIGEAERPRNLPVPAGLNDSEMRVLIDQAVIPAIRGHRPDAIMVQCGADGLAEDPQSKLALSNNAYFDVCRQLLALDRAAGHAGRRRL